MKVMTIVGTRPEVIKLWRVIAELDRTFGHVLVHTGQNYDYALNQVFFEELGVRRPDHFLEAAAASPAETIANVVARADKVLAAGQPDALLLLGDTNSCLAAIAAKRRRVPVFHMEAGNRCFDERVPEENTQCNRHPVEPWIVARGRSRDRENLEKPGFLLLYESSQPVTPACF